MNKYHNWINTGLTVALFILVLVGGNNQSSTLGGGTRFPNGLSADSTSPVAGELRGADLTLTDDAVIAGGSLTVTTTNAATSTTAVGCIQTVATSTATAIRLIIGTPNTAASSSASTAINAGFVNWGYGSCPN